MKRVMYLTLLLFAALAVDTASAQQAGWSRLVKAGNTEIVVYQPQPDSFDGKTLESRVAISVKRLQDHAPLFGALWATAALEVDSARDRARVASVRIERTRFPGLRDTELRPLIEFLKADVPLWDLSISLSELKASLQPARGDPEAGYRNDPPRIIVEDHPAILLLLDSEPKLRDAGFGLQQVMNTAIPSSSIPRPGSIGSSERAHGLQPTICCAGNGFPPITLPLRSRAW
jgi:hypothetical protein